MSDETVAGPILDALKKKIAEIIENPEDFIALVKLLLSLMPKEGVFSAPADNAAVAEVMSLLQQVGDS